ncbi:MAG: hypothetical protein V3U84_03260 [Thiotrichaceae bacterium]
MKISKLTHGLLVSLLLSASAVEADSDYPATNFQPKVVFQDSDYKHSGSSSSKAKSSSVKGEVSVADSNFPAANFQPEVLFEDKSYKHSKGKVTSSSTTSGGSSSYETSSEGASSSEGDDSSMSLVMGLAVLAIAGFLFYSKNNGIKLPTKKRAATKRAPARRKAAPAVAGSDNGGSVSGVAKYLESKGGVEPSGVAKYLDDRNSSPSSGVAKYVAKKKISARLASVTGVEKYLKDRS